MRRVPSGVALAMPALVTLFLSFNAGGYLGTETLLAGVAVAAALAAVLATSPHAARWGPLGWMVGGALALLALWTLLSWLWSPLPGLVEHEAARSFLYLGVFGLTLSARPDAAGARRLVQGLAASMAAVSLAAFVARTLPGLYPVAVDLDQFGLNYPITYANALALMVAVAIVLCFYMATSGDEAPGVQRLAAAALPVLGSTLALTLSVGAAVGCCAAVVGYVAAGRPRELARGSLATVPPTIVAAGVTLDADLLFTADATSAEAVAQGRTVAIVAILCAADAALVRLLADRVRLPSVTGVLRGRSGRIGAALAGLAVVALIGLALSAFPSGNGEGSAAVAQRPPEGIESRGRYWEAALKGFGEAPLAGRGAGSFRRVWADHRPVGGRILDAHSLYLETLAELGIVGGLLLVSALAAIALAFWRLARTRNPSVYGALVATGALWLVTAAFEWVWELPAASAWFFAVGAAALSAAYGARVGNRTQSGTRNRWRPPWTAPIRN